MQQEEPRQPGRTPGERAPEQGPGDGEDPRPLRAADTWGPPPGPPDPPAGEGPQAGSGASGSAPTGDIGTPEPVGDGGTKDRVVEALKTVYDPEIPVDIHELGLIYGIRVDAGGEVTVTMTLTSPNCPAAGSLPGEVEAKTARVEGVTKAKVNVVWDPPWGMEMMSEAARLQLGLM